MQNSTSPGSNIPDFLKGSGRARKLLQQMDWSVTPLGHPLLWEPVLKTTVEFMLNSPLPKCVIWGEEFIQIYNDAYWSIIDFQNLPVTPGKSAKAGLAPIWNQIGEGYERVMKGETIILRDYKLDKNNDQLPDRYFDFYKAPIWREDGSVGGILLTAIETTEKVSANEELARSRESLMLIMRSAPVAMVVFNGPDFVVEIANDKALKLWGRSADAVIGKPILEGISEFKGQGFEQIFDEVFKAGSSIQLKEKLVCLSSGQKTESIYLDLSYEPLRNGENKIYGVISTCVDVTASVVARHQLEDAEERTRVALQAADMGTFDLQVETHYIVTSDRFDEIFGIDKSDNHDDYFDVIHPDDLGDRQKTLNDAFVTGRLLQEYRVIKRSGDMPWVRIQGKVYFNHAGKPVRILGTALDITEQRRLQQVKDDFISIASHELKTPLTSLNASLQLLSRKINTGDAVVNAMLGQANSSLKKLTKLSGDLLDVSKIRTGKGALNLSRIRMADLAKSAGANLLAFSKHRLIISGDIEATVVADGGKIEQVLTNFISNAAKYAPESKDITVLIKSNTAQVKVAVIDKGPGIPEEILPRLFDRYFQAGSSAVQFSGLGLGLFIAAEIIRSHGGTIGVESKVGNGSAFWFSLPDK
ncbi:PAS domain-containing sensor histidine kinase [Mucilaginibacter sp. CSA2-8R]|uniref:sensor histidine kinase n=1 Tax=Mucilaginibacter sp. CSA2-8R TaxID=3141542 RepID=UPI00315C6B20